MMDEIEEEGEDFIFLRSRKWKIRDREESWALGRLLHNRLNPPGKFIIENYDDPKEVIPSARRALDGLQYHAIRARPLDERLDILEDVIAPAMNALYELCMRVAERHDIPTVASRAWYFHDYRNEDELRRTRTDRPADLTQIITDNASEMIAYGCCRDVCIGTDPARMDRFDGILNSIPPDLMPVIRLRRAALGAQIPVRAGYHTWLEARLAVGAARKEIMSEINRLWEGDPELRRLARTELEEMEASGKIRREATRGPVSFVTIAP